MNGAGTASSAPKTDWPPMKWTNAMDQKAESR